MATETMTAGLVSEAEWVDLLRQFDTDLDARVRVLAIDPTARDLVRRINEASDALGNIPLPATMKDATAAVDTALQETNACRQRKDAALEAWRKAKADHEKALESLEQAKGTAARLRKTFDEFMPHVRGIGRAGLALLKDALIARGIRVKGDTVILPE